MLQLGSILEPTWLHFGRVLGGRDGANLAPNGSKTDPKNDQNNDHLLDRLKLELVDLVGGPTRPPKKESN